MTDETKRRMMLGSLLKVVGTLFICAGSFFAFQGEPPVFTFTDPETDKYLGYSLMGVGLMDIVLALTLFNLKKTK